MPGPTPDQPGWYDDGEGHERWFDGNAWTDHVRTEQDGEQGVGPDTAPIAGGSTVVVPAAQRPGPPPATAQLQQLQVGGGRGLRIAISVLGALVLVAVAVVGVLVLLGRDGEDEGTDDATSPSGTETVQDPSTLDVPTIDPSDFPTDVPPAIPTELPTEWPTIPGIPTDLPTEFPTEFLTAVPTDPEDFASLASEFLEQ